MMYHAAADRYEKMPVRHAGKTGLMLPVISLALWQLGSIWPATLGDFGCV